MMPDFILNLRLATKRLSPIKMLGVVFKTSATNAWGKLNPSVAAAEHIPKVHLHSQRPSLQMTAPQQNPYCWRRRRRWQQG